MSLTESPAHFVVCFIRVPHASFRWRSGKAAKNLRISMVFVRRMECGEVVEVQNFICGAFLEAQERLQPPPQKRDEIDTGYDARNPCTLPVYTCSVTVSNDLNVYARPKRSLFGSIRSSHLAKGPQTPRYLQTFHTEWL